MFKGVKVFVASLFAMLLCAAPASAISFSSLEQISEPTDNIEINTPEDGYAFDANFLAKNQELKYKPLSQTMNPYQLKSKTSISTPLRITSSSTPMMASLLTIQLKPAQLEISSSP